MVNITDGRAKTVHIKNARGRKVSSQRWLQRHLNDPYVHEANKQGYRSRAAYKILEIQEKYKIFKKGQIVVDLGAAPGGWCQMILPLIQSPDIPCQLYALDLLLIEPLADVNFIQGDFLDVDVQGQLINQIGDQKVDVVVSDMAANTIGHKATDHLRTRILAECAFQFANKFLKPGGVFISKVFEGGTHAELLKDLKTHFTTIRHFKPNASRKESPEIYVVCTDYKS